MGIELVVLDFDGTITDIDKEAVPAVIGWKKDAGKELGFTDEEIQRRWANAESKIKSNPQNYGWVKSNKIIAPACADPLVMATVTTQVLFDEESKYLDEHKRDEVSYKIFKNNYKKSKTVFKEGAKQFLSELKNQFHVYIVTNSASSEVSKKVQKLSNDHTNIPIYGEAGKYILHPDWTDVPESVERKGFGRPLFLRRKQYWNVIKNIMKEKGVSPDKVAVVGDIYELDLLLPEYKGMRVVLTPQPTAADFELAAVKSYSKGYIAESLRNVLEHLKSHR